jgi:hypothetical protein
MKVVVVDGEDVLLGEPRLNIEKSGNEDYVVLVKKSSRGNSNDNAKESINDIVYRYELKDSTVYFDPYFYLDNDAKWRMQEVAITLKVPEGKAIYFDDDMLKIIHDVDNASNTWVGDMVGKTWVMQANGLILKESE